MPPTGTVDLCVIGGGSGGFATALAAARRGRSVVLVEKADCLGGNAVRCGVNTWEMGVGGTDIPRTLYERMSAVPGAVGIYSNNRHCCWPHRNDPPFPGGESLIDPSRTYADTLQRHGTRGIVDDAERARELWHGVTFEPEVCAAEQYRMLDETGCCTILLNHSFVDAEAASEGVLDSITVEQGGRRFSIRARNYVDATADIVVCQSLGCPCMQGREAAATFGEESAPERADPDGVNAATLVYRITARASQPSLNPAERWRAPGRPWAGVAETCWFREEWPVASFTQLPNGDRMVNMLPTMEGSELLNQLRSWKDGYERAHRECTRRVDGHWRHIRTICPEFRDWHLMWIAPSLGIRESRRVVGEAVLTEPDVVNGLSGQDHPDIIAIADHALDTHGRHTRGCIELAQPYGIPFRCLVPRGWQNLLVACRGASFSHLAASSCRLSRTMMALGHAAGLAVDLAIETGDSWKRLDMDTLRRRLWAEGAPRWQTTP